MRAAPTDRVVLKWAGILELESPGHFLLRVLAPRREQTEKEVGERKPRVGSPRGALLLLRKYRELVGWNEMYVFGDCLQLLDRGRA